MNGVSFYCALDALRKGDRQLLVIEQGNNLKYELGCMDVLETTHHNPLIRGLPFSTVLFYTWVKKGNSNTNPTTQPTVSS